MRWVRKMVSIALLLSFLPVLFLRVRAADKAAVEPYAQSMIQLYRYYQEAAEENIAGQLEQMERIDPEQAAVWEKIMKDWSWVNSGMPVYEDALPDGLPEDDSLAIVVLGYGLNEDGTMKEELVDRLVVALTSALKYPNAWIVLTGGETSEVKGVSEAGQMAVWLQRKGVEKSRLITETQSLSTTANAVNVYKLLTSSYPQVDSIAVITSDYHIAWGCSQFTTVSHYKSGYEGSKHLELTGAAVCDTGATADTILSQAWGISAITGVTFEEDAERPTLYRIQEATEPETEPVEETANTEVPAQAQEGEQDETPSGKNYVVLALAVILLAAGYIIMPKKPREKREKPEWKWE